MKIVVPSYVLEEANLNDHQKVFMSLMFALERKTDNETEYIFRSTDVKKITNNYSLSFENPNRNLAELQKVINFAAYDAYNWGISFNQHKKILATVGSNKGLMLEGVTEITNERAIKIWFYLIGRLTDKSLISDNEHPFPHKMKQNPNMPNFLSKQLKQLDPAK